MARITLVHGWNVPDAGAQTVDKLAPHLRRYGHEPDCDEADYGYLTWQMFSWVARKAMRPFIVRRLTDAFEKADVIVTHSNGANFAMRALRKMDQEPRRRLLFHFSPALNQDAARPDIILRMFVFHTRTDWAVRFATYLPFHPWGRMGALGPDPLEPGTEALDYSGTVKGHSDWFKVKGNPERFAQVIDANIRRHLP